MVRLLNLDHVARLQMPLRPWSAFVKHRYVFSLWGCCHNAPQIGGGGVWKHQVYPVTVWRPEVQSQGVGGAAFPPEAPGADPSRLLSFRGLLVFLNLWPHQPPPAPVVTRRLARVRVLFSPRNPAQHALTTECLQRPYLQITSGPLVQGRLQFGGMFFGPLYPINRIFGLKVG